MNNFLYILIGLAALILHIILSKKENKFLGLIIPSLNLLLSVLAVCGFILFNGVGGHYHMDTIVGGISIFISYNLYTVVLLVIYFSCRKKLNKNNELKK